MSNIISSRQKSRFPLPFKIVATIIAVVVVLNFFAPQALSSFFTMIVRPLWKFEQGPVDPVMSAASLEAFRTELTKENDDLKALLGRPRTSTTVLAQILKKPPLSAYDTFILDVGDDKKIAKGDKVYAGIIPIGEIAEVLGNTSKVKLYSSSGEKFDVFIGEAHIQATAEGMGGGSFQAVLPQDSKILVGDAVLIPSLSDAFLGTVQAIVAEPSHPFASILFNQPINIYELRWVVVESKS